VFVEGKRMRIEAKTEQIFFNLRCTLFDFLR
jgi:hypothetical protein